MARPDAASDADVRGFLRTSPAWRLEDRAVVREATAPSFLDAIRWVTEVAELAERMDHHPDIDIRWRTVAFRLSTHDVGALTALDFELARQIDAVVGREAAPPTPA